MMQLVCKPIHHAASRRRPNSILRIAFVPLLWSIFPAVAATAQQQQVSITRLDGEPVVGILQSITADSVALTVGSEQSSLPLAQVMTVEFPAPQSTPAPQQILLSDNNTLACDQIRRSTQQVSATSPWLGQLQIPPSRVKAIRLQAENSELTAQWESYRDRIPSGDLLVVLKRGGDGLDFLEGNIVSIAADKIEFLLDGDTIPVPPSRVYGVVFAKVDQQTKPSAARLNGAAGQSIGLDAVEFRENQFRVTASWGQKLNVPADSVQTLDFSSGRIRYLSDLEWISERMYGLDPPGSAVKLDLSPEFTQLENEWYRPQRNGTFEKGVPIRLRGRQFARGLCMRSKSEVTYALDQRFTALQALVGVDDEVAFNLKRKVALTIRGDDQVLFSQDFATSDDPFPLNISVQGISTLTILVDYADNDSSCDWLDLADAKLLLVTDE